MAILVTGLAVWWLARPSPPVVTRLALPLQEGHQQRERERMAISPDGRNFIYAARPSRGGASLLYLRPMDQLQATALQGTERARNPFFS
ncbi:MAG: hypothetical protein E2P02_02005 [Acidobacteria bacterium]|nr:MAG: hypothetical protein E2P02_02005 [Acidobacteriota bacterium]